MEYTINKLSQIAKISTRTLRYYDEIDLLKPKRINTNGYRIYGVKEVDLLQQILFYRELGMALEEIKSIIYSPGFDSEKALESHLNTLIEQQKRMTVLIQNVQKTILAMKGETVMSDKEKFEGFKQKLIEDNEKQYGKEVRQKYGDEVIDQSNKNFKKMTKKQYTEIETLRKEYEKSLKDALLAGDPYAELAQKACQLHKQWLCYFHHDYNKEYHMGLGEIYVEDERFKAYYEKIAPGCAEFFCEAIRYYTSH